MTKPSIQETSQYIQDSIIAHIDNKGNEVVVFDYLTMGTVRIPIVSIDDFTGWLDKELGFIE